MIIIKLADNKLRHKLYLYMDKWTQSTGTEWESKMRRISIDTRYDFSNEDY